MALISLWHHKRYVGSTMTHLGSRPPLGRLHLFFFFFSRRRRRKERFAETGTRRRFLHALPGQQWRACLRRFTTDWCGAKAAVCPVYLLQPPRFLLLLPPPYVYLRRSHICPPNGSVYNSLPPPSRRSMRSDYLSLRGCGISFSSVFHTFCQHLKLFKSLARAGLSSRAYAIRTLYAIRTVHEEYEKKIKVEEHRGRGRKKEREND